MNRAGVEGHAAARVVQPPQQHAGATQASTARF